MWELSYDENKEEFTHPYFGCVSVSELLSTQVNFSFSHSFMTRRFIDYRKILRREIRRPEAKRILYWLLTNPTNLSHITCRLRIPETIFFIYRAYPDMTKSVIEYVLSVTYRLRDAPMTFKTILSPYGVPASCLLYETKDDRLFDLYKKMYRMLSFDFYNPRFLYSLLFFYISSSASPLLCSRFCSLMFDAFHYGVTPTNIQSYDYILRETGYHRAFIEPCNISLHETYDLFIVHKCKLTLFEILTLSRHYRNYK